MAKSILIVDDEAYIRLLLQQIFADAEENGFITLDDAANGTQALEKARASTPDLIFLDIMMPEMDGLSVCRALRQDNAFKKTRIVLLTARGQSEDKAKGITAGADAYVTKPFDPDHIITIAAKLLDIALEPAP